MKNFFKKVAFVLALAMVLTNIGPAASASAAEAPGVRYKSRVLYVGGSENGNYPESCWTPSKNNEGWKVTYSTDSNIIDLTSNGKITANGKGIGLAVVNVTYSKAGQKDVPDTFNVKVRRNATDVRLTNATKEKIAEALKIGQEIVLSSAKSITTPASYAKGNYGLDNYRAVCSDEIAYYSSDDKVFTVEGNKLTAVGNGTATLTVYTYQYLDETKTPVVYAEYEITVAGGMLSVNQKAIKQLEVLMGNAEGVKASDFTITRVASKMNVAIKDISVDGNVVTINTFAEMKDGAEYTVEYDEREIVFTATDNTVDEITVNTVTIEAGGTEGTEISANLIDVNGVVLDTIKNTTGRPNVSFTVETNEGYMNGDKLILFETGNSAKLTVTYRTGQYDNTTGAEVGTVPREFTIVAVDPTPAVPGSLKYVIGDEPDWDALTSNASICVSETKNLRLYKKDSKDTDLTKTAGYTYESSNNDMLIVNTWGDNGGKGAYVDITAVKAGTAFILIKKDNVVIDTVMITVKAERAFNTFTLTETSFSLSNSMSIGSDADKVVKVQYKDQYGDDLGGNDYSVDQISGPTATPIPANIVGNEITFVPAGATAGTYQFKVTKGNVTKVINVVVQNASNGGSLSYKLLISGDKTDIACTDAADGNKDITVKVGKYVGGVLDGYQSMTDVSIKKDGSVKGSDSGSVASLTMAARTISGTSVVKAATGSYVVTATINPGNAITLSGGFVINDTQKAMTVKVEKVVDVTTGDPEAMVKEVMDFYYNGSKVGDKATKINVIEVKSPNKGNKLSGDAAYTGTVAISEVVVEYEVAASRWVTFTVAVNKTITLQ